MSEKLWVRLVTSNQYTTYPKGGGTGKSLIQIMTRDMQLVGWTIEELRKVNYKFTDGWSRSVEDIELVVSGEAVGITIITLTRNPTTGVPPALDDAELKEFANNYYEEHYSGWNIEEEFFQ